MAVIADKCPNIIVTVLDIDNQRILDWNNKIYLIYQFMNQD